MLRNKWRNATSLPTTSTNDEKGDEKGGGKGDQEGDEKSDEKSNEKSDEKSDRQQVEGIRLVFGIGRVVHSGTQRNYSGCSTTALVGETGDQYEL